VWHEKTAADIWHHVMLKMQHDGKLQPGRYLHEKVLIMEWKLQQRDEARQEAQVDDRVADDGTRRMKY
jgi:hypothetical protein